MRTSTRPARALLTLLSLVLAVSPSHAATLKWKPYRPVTKDQPSAPAKPTMTAPVGNQPNEQVRQAAAQETVENNDALADPFEDSTRSTSPTGDANLQEPSVNSTESLPVQEDTFPSLPAEEPERLEPQEDYFPEERVPDIDRGNDSSLPDQEAAPDYGSPSLSDELRSYENNVAEATDCKTEKADCADALSKLKANTLANIDLDINISGVEGRDFPCECAFGIGETFEGRNWKCITYTWKASGLCHKPLYFEQVAVERYGHSAPTLVQDVLSGAHFFATIPALPYAMGLCPPDECQYSLGYYRPGNCAPYLIDPIPLSLRAGLFQAGAIVGGILIIP